MTNHELACQITRNDILNIQKSLVRVENRIHEYGTSDEILHECKKLKSRLEILVFALSTEKGNK